MMEETRIILAGVWVALMLTYLLGDVLRIFAGDFTPGEIDGEPAAPWTWMAAAHLVRVELELTSSGRVRSARSRRRHLGGVRTPADQRC